MNALKAFLILGTGLMMSLLVFPWLDSLRDNWYHPVTPTLQQYISEGDSADAVVVSDNWAAQSFTVASSYTLTGVQVKVWRTSGTGTLTVAVYAGDVNGYPTGAALGSGTVSSAVISMGTPGEFESVTFSTALEVTPATYVVVLHYAGTGQINWRVVSGGSGYAYSTDGGSSWSH